MMKTVILGLAMATGIATSAIAANIIEVNHPALKNKKDAIVHYACLTKAEASAEYGADQIIFPMPDTIRNAGGVIRSFGDSIIFLTTEECLDDIKKSIVKSGEDPDSYSYIAK